MTSGAGQGFPGYLSADACTDDAPLHSILVINLSLRTRLGVAACYVKDDRGKRRTVHCWTKFTASNLLSCNVFGDIRADEDSRSRPEHRRCHPASIAAEA